MATVTGTGWGAPLTPLSLEPSAWTTGEAEGRLEQIVDVMRERRDHVDSWLETVLGAMQ
jgi:hypothetical protein